ncbi:sensor histidine kinase [Propionimicrobium lymphophilum]|uniref:sensor histidine kinase n=1 Tax=Propionimicrobium lymphophilum TaxID=33012 RepID=UPI002551C3EF|nr:sensor histidine kinase [Propionimicrobium lymphophilum]MDK7710590.1 sensor histidine kinase [Propionimicrobium lymphophilum]MDK7733824.1 sensor histidine kinase [Propionimicrobium lymphophilum]
MTTDNSASSLTRTKYPTLLDAVLTIVLVFATSFWGDLWGNRGESPSYLASVVTSIGMTSSLFFRRSQPWLMLALICASGGTQLILVPHPTWALAAVPIASYSMARMVQGIAARWLPLICGLGAVIGPLRWTAGISEKSEKIESTVALILLCLAWIVIPYLLGRRDQETAVAELERAEGARKRYESEVARQAEAERATETRVRNEIARELHDIVAHSLSVIVVQAEGGKALAKKHPDKAVDVLETIGETGREALVEMRRIVGVLRNGNDAEYAPSPGLADIGDLVKRAGSKVTLTERGTRPTLSAAVGLTIYRVTQEALTNVMKHSGSDARVSVGLRYEPSKVEVSIYDDGGEDKARPAEVSGTGYGIRGMRERVQAVGGKLNAGPLGAGWLVQAVIPVNRKG